MLTMTEDDWKNFKHFSEREFKCSCCGEVDMDEPFIAMLDTIREETDVPMIITSGFRCKNHPIEAAKQAPGPHNTGAAADIAVWGDDAGKIIRAFWRYMIPNDVFGGVGLKQHGPVEERFIHLDTLHYESTRGPRPHVWTYE